MLFVRVSSTQCFQANLLLIFLSEGLASWRLLGQIPKTMVQHGTTALVLVTSSFLLLVEMPGATSSVLLLVVRCLVPGGFLTPPAGVPNSDWTDRTGFEAAKLRGGPEAPWGVSGESAGRDQPENCLRIHLVILVSAKSVSTTFHFRGGLN